MNGSSNRDDRLSDQGETSLGIYVLTIPHRHQAEEMGMQNAHMSALELKHAGLDARITEENQRPHPDVATLSRLKKEKLRVKEALLGL